MIIKWCLYLRSKSAACYKVLRESGFLHLPSERTLYDYSHVFHCKNGFDATVVDRLRNEVSGFSENWQRYVGLLQDEIKVKSDLVYDKQSGELVGFVNLDLFSENIRTMNCTVDYDNPPLAKYLLVLMMRGIATSLNFPWHCLLRQQLLLTFST